jgi:NTP pyrophosphatase (non-canonical NTP hydrolase)
MSDFKGIITELLKFRDDKDWAKFHNPKDLAIAINIESSELLELFLWKTAEQANPEKIKEELADILAYSCLLAEKYGWDLKQIMAEKIAKNALKYPVNKSNGTATQYSDL